MTWVGGYRGRSVIFWLWFESTGGIVDLGFVEFGFKKWSRGNWSERVREGEIQSRFFKFDKFDKIKNIAKSSKIYAFSVPAFRLPTVIICNLAGTNRHLAPMSSGC